MIYKITKFGKAALMVGTITVLLLFIMNTEVHFHPFTFHIHEAEKLMVVFLQVCGFLFFDLNGQCAGFKRGLLFATEMLERENEKREKKGEQKPADKVDPKFNVGDWIIGQATNNEPRQISEITDQCYKSTYGGQYGFSFEDEMHLWTIQDAKAGDVLATLDYILVFKEFLKNDGGISYCHYDFGAGNPQFVWLEDKNWHFGKEAIIHPATKEQRDLLFSKMKEAGYEWDAEKKELRTLKS